MNTILCPSCKLILDNSARFCERCGSVIDVAATVPTNTMISSPIEQRPTEPLDSDTAILPILGGFIQQPYGGNVPSASSVPSVQSTPQVSGVPSVQGAP